MPLFIGSLSHAENAKKVPQEGLISNYGVFQNLWRVVNYVKGNNRKQDILEAIHTHNKEAFKNNFIKGDLIQQSDIVVEIILSNNLEFLRILEEEMDVDIKGVIDRYEACNKKSPHELPHALAEKHGSQAEEMFNYLHERGFILNAKNEQGDTIATIALQTKDKKLFKNLLGAIIDPNDSNNNGESLVHKTAYLDDHDYFSIALKSADSATINSKDNNGKTPLHIATEENDDKKIEALVNSGADVSIGDKEGITPAHQAAAGECSVQCAKIIFNAPTMDPKATTNEGKSVRRTLKDAHHRCLKDIEKIHNRKSKIKYNKHCSLMTGIYNAFKQSRFVHLKDKTQKLIEEKNNLFEQQALLSGEEIEHREKAITDELERIQLEKDKVREKLALQRTELNEQQELITSLKQEFEQENIVSELDDVNNTKEKFTDDSH